jgi:Flp pilus assembly protein TadD
MAIFVASFIFILSSPLSVLCQTQLPRPAKTISWEAKGQALIQAGRFAEAVDHFNRIKRTHPQDARPYFYSGMALLESGKLTQAASELEEAVRLGPGKPEYLLFKATVQSRLGNAVLATRSLAAFSQNSEVSKLSPAWMWLLADAYYRCQKPDDALRVLDLLGQRTPTDSKVDLNRGQAYLLKGETDLARKSLQKSLQRNSVNNPIAYYEFGKLLHQLSEMPAAKQALVSAVQQAPSNPEYAYQLATVCLALNQDAEALNYLRAVENAGTTLPEIYYALARACRKLGKTPEAEDYLKKFQANSSTARRQADKNREAGKLIALGEKQIDQNNKAEARRLFEEALKVNPKEWSAHGYIAEMLLDSEEWAKSYGHLVKMEEVEPDSVTGGYLMAKYWYRRADFKQARDYAERATALRPANSELRYLLGHIYAKLGLSQDALKQYEAAVNLSPTETEYQERLKSFKAELASSKH